MAALPEGISTALVHMDAPVSFIGEPGRLHVEIISSASLIWAPTGTPIANFEDNIDLADGVALEIELPHVDQPGFEDGNGNAFSGWYYTVTVTYEMDGQLRNFEPRDFQVLVGQDDVDLALLPSGESYVPSVAPILPVTSFNGRTGAVVPTKADVGLGNADNTSDANKPISTAAQAALDLKADKSNPTFTGTVSGVSKAMVGLGNADNTADIDKPVSNAQQEALNLKAPKDSPTFTGTVSGVSKGMVGLGNVDNTSDAAKPVSTAQAAAISAKADKASPTFTGTVTLPATTNGLSKSNVGLGNVDNTSDLAKPLSTAATNALNTKAALSHPHVISDVTGLQAALDAKDDKPFTTSVTITLSNAVSGTAAVTFPAGKYSVTPLVFLTKQGGQLVKFIPYVASGATKDSCFVGVYSGDGLAGTGSVVLAVQVVPAP